MTSQGNPRTVFRRAIKHGNLVTAEVNARLCGHLDLREALELTALIAQSDRERGGRAGARWLARLVAERNVSLDNVDLALASLRALGTERHDATLAILRDLSR